MNGKDVKKGIKKTWHFLWHEDSVMSWIVSLLVAFILIKFIVYPGLGLILGTQFPVVAVVSNSMEHDGNYEEWWAVQEDFYLKNEITREEFKTYPFTNGFNKGDIMLLLGAKPEKLKRGDVLVFWSGQPYPIIHRIITIDLDINTETKVYQTKGDHNRGQVKNTFLDETNIQEDQIVGRAVVRIPYLGWVKIWFVDLINVILGRGGQDPGWFTIDAS